jgi:hypothetical protein
MHDAPLIVNMFVCGALPMKLWLDEDAPLIVLIVLLINMFVCGALLLELWSDEDAPLIMLPINMFVCGNKDTPLIVLLLW